MGREFVPTTVHDPKEFIQRDATAAGDVHHLPGYVGRFARAKDAVDHVGDVGEVARLLRSAKNVRLLSTLVAMLLII